MAYDMLLVQQMFLITYKPDLPSVIIGSDCDPVYHRYVQ